MSRDIIKATTSGIHTVRSFSFAALADDSTGAMIRATTAGRMPMNMAEMTWLFLIVSGVRKMANARIIRNEGRIVPRAAKTEPRPPPILSPTAVAMLTARMPGSDCEMASRSRNSSRSIQ